MRRVKITWDNQADEKEWFDPDHAGSLWEYLSKSLERYEYAIVRWFEAEYNEKTGDQTPWELSAELRGAMARE